MRQNTDITDTEDRPVPLLEVGDFVRLNEPEQITRDRLSLHPEFAQAVTAIALQRYLQDRSLVSENTREFIDRRLESEQDVNATVFIDEPAFNDLFIFTHGIVAEIVTRCSSSQISFEYSQVLAEHDLESPPRGVSLHLMNPKCGLTYTGSHPTESGKPEFVDTNATELTLIHKHDEKWNTKNEIPVADAYNRILR